MTQQILMLLGHSFSIGVSFLSLLEEMTMNFFMEPGWNFLYGFLFLLGRDAFSAIDLLIAEMNEIV